MPRKPTPPRPLGNRCAIYRRRSKLDGEGSLPVQLQTCQAYAESHGWVILADEVDQESAYLDASAGRAGYLRIMELARGGHIDHVIVWQLTRFGRDAAEALSRIKELKRLGVQLHSTSEDLTNQLLAGILAVMAEDESRRISDRVRPRKRMLAAQGRHQGRLPFGTVRVAGQLLPGPRFDLVRTAFDLAASGLGVVAVTRELGARFGLERPLNVTLISDVLHNPAYIGTLRGQLPDGYGEVPGSWPAMIDRQVWEAAQATLTWRRRVQRQFGLQDGWWLRGLVRCGVCGGNCSIIQSAMLLRSGERRLYHTYTCNHKCRGVQARAVALQEWVSEQVRPLHFLPSHAAAIEQTVARYNDAMTGGPASAQVGWVRDREQATGRRDRIEQLLIDGHLQPDRVAVRLREVEAEIRALDLRLAALPRAELLNPAALAALLTTPAWHEQREDAPDAYRSILGLFVDAVRIGGGEWAVSWTPLARVLLAG